VFTEPFNSLNFNASKRLGESKNTTLSVKAENLLNDLVESRFDYFGDSTYVFSSFAPGINVSLGLTMRF
ncbi:MAG: hypothetical protein VW580_04540, partial [Flavobacteriaceae bacterium]